MKGTAVEWLVQEMINNGLDYPISEMSKILEQAKEMEKEQIIDANIAGQMFIGACPGHYKNDAEDYYNDTFKQD